MRRRIALTLLAVASLLAGCAAPEHQYISAPGMYFSLPASWQAIRQQQLITAESGWSDDAGNVLQQSMRWQGAWSKTVVNANAVFAAKASSTPIVFAYVRDLLSQERQGVGNDVAAALKDVAMPATAVSDAGNPVETTTLKQAGFTGIRQRATYVSGGVMQTIDVVSMLPPKRDRLYVLLARCTARCYASQSAVIDALFDSLTFKEPRGN